ncbi:uncharacterized protein I206_104964 [Kwoniella pini CBS 10737]|uniref:Xeroderma pigmentosum group C-complementing protein n=1 Tax=Kwoniella pini CBS 10737 TaxID=1296096 RepID=A0A1B9I8D0_9TREE|nr:xeroderma pigmentosum group C-complementing protein [Kwoniella pini CBS 10737]OCF51787.1 xeroderma pigmentosum group C-complementing protein [Kwoniella pini CBS 10737]
MSASRPKSKKVIPKAGPSTHSKLTPKANKVPPKATTNGSRRHAPPPPSEEVIFLMEKGKGKAKAQRPTAPRSITSVRSTDEEDEDDEFEEVAIPSIAGPSSPYPGTPNTGGNITAGTTPGTNTTAPSIDYDLDGYGEGSGDESAEEEEDGVIHLEIGGETAEEKAKRIALALRKKPITSKDRAIRLEIHKMHVISLLASAGIRNRWCSNTLLKARLLSLLPNPLQTAFSIPPSRFPDKAQRSRLFFDALQDLVTWWSQSFFDISDPTLGLRTRPWDDIQEIIDQLPKLTRADLTPSHYLAQSKEKGKEREDALEKMSIGSGSEKLRSVNSLMKKALQQEGSRDVSAQLFVALARACGLGARLVTSLQVVPWRAEKVVQKKKPGAGRGGRTVASRQGMGPNSDDEEDEEDEFEEVPIPGEEGPKERKNNVRAAGTRRLQDPTDLYRLRAPKPPPQIVGKPSKPKSKAKQDLSEQPPVFWAEIFSRSDQRWIPVDPVAGTIRKKTHYEPTSDSGPIRMVYVVAFEEDGYARDVTLRYTKNFGAKTSKLRVPAKKDEPDWWEAVMGFLTRPYRLNRDELEDAELETSQYSEGMPLHMSGFKDHPIYVLERHLKREEIIQPKREIGRFRGEAVYRRANVVQCKTAETWMRVGRRVKDKQEPLKWVKQRAVTLQKRRAQELAVQETGEAIQQGLYAEYQTELYTPPPIKDGIIPQNSFGNIDLYAPTMLPPGAVHLPYKGIAKVAKGLEISYAEACTGFEFKKQRAIPTINGIVVAKENEEMVMDAYAESAAAAEEKERMKKEEKALKRWAKLINGLRVRLRLQAEYGTGEQLDESSALNPLADPATASEVQSKPKKSAASVLADAHQQGTANWTDRMREKSLSPKSDEEEEMQDVHPSTSGEEVQPINADVVEVQATDEETDFKPPKEDFELDSEVAQPPVSTGRPTRITLKLNKLNGTTTPKSQPTRSSTRSVKKRKVQDTVEDDVDLIDEEEVESIPKSLTRGRVPTAPRLKKAKSQVPSVAAQNMTRSLRSRAPKSAQQIEEEEDKRRKLQEALEGDSDVDFEME